MVSRPGARTGGPSDGWAVAGMRRHRAPPPAARQGRPGRRRPCHPFPARAVTITGSQPHGPVPWKSFPYPDHAGNRGNTPQGHAIGMTDDGLGRRTAPAPGRTSTVLEQGRPPGGMQQGLPVQRGSRTQAPHPQGGGGPRPAVRNRRQVRGARPEPGTRSRRDAGKGAWSGTARWPAAERSSAPGR